MPACLSPLSRSQALVVVALVVALLGAVGQVRAAADAPFRSAYQHMVDAAAGKAGAADESAAAFDALLQAEPANPVLMAYAGASTSMKATTTMLPWKKMGYAEDGLALLDKSLAMLKPEHDAPIQRGVPGSLEVRFVAASTFLAVPGFMNRGARGTKLLNEVLASPLFAQAPLPFRGNVWMRAAALATREQRTDDAHRYLNDVIASQAPQAEQALALLKASA